MLLRRRRLGLGRFLSHVAVFFFVYFSKPGAGAQIRGPGRSFDLPDPFPSEIIYSRLSIPAHQPPGVSASLEHSSLFFTFHFPSSPFRLLASSPHLVRLFASPRLASSPRLLTSPAPPRLAYSSPRSPASRRPAGAAPAARRQYSSPACPVSYTHLTLPTTPYV